MYVLSELTREGFGAAQGCSICDYYCQYSTNHYTRFGFLMNRIKAFVAT
jgi:hypothetical protein